MAKGLEFKILIDRKISTPKQSHNFEYGSEYRNDLQNAVSKLACWNAILTTLGGVRLIGAYLSFNAAIASTYGSLINIIYNNESRDFNSNNSKGDHDGYQQGLILSDTEQIAREDLR